MAFTLTHLFTRQAITEDGPRRDLLAQWAESHPEDFRGIALPSKRPSKEDADALSKANQQIVELDRKREEDRKEIETLRDRIGLQQDRIAELEQEQTHKPKHK